MKTFHQIEEFIENGWQVTITPLLSGYHVSATKDGRLISDMSNNLMGAIESVFEQWRIFEPIA